MILSKIIGDNRLKPYMHLLINMESASTMNCMRLQVYKTSPTPKWLKNITNSLRQFSHRLISPLIPLDMVQRLCNLSLTLNDFPQRQLTILLTRGEELPLKRNQKISHLLLLLRRRLPRIIFNNQRSLALYFIRDVTFYFCESVLAGEVKLVYGQLWRLVRGALGFYPLFRILGIVAADLFTEG